jgi:hypothetical protein
MRSLIAISHLLPACTLVFALSGIGPQVTGTLGSAGHFAAFPSLKIFVDQDGIVQLTAADLTAAGWSPAGVDPRTIVLTNLGAEVAVWIEGGDDGVFDVEDAVVFYGRAATGPYTRRNVYWLTAGDEPGLRMAERDAAAVHGYSVPTSFPATLHAEQDTAPWGYWQNPPGCEAQDHWYWTGPLTAPATATLTFAMPPFDGTGSVALRIALAGKTDDYGAAADHHTQVALNGAVLSDARWDGRIVFVQAAAVPSVLLAAGTNTVTLQTLADTGARVNELYVNWLEVDYAARYEAQGDRLAFTAPGADAYRFEVAGFTGPDVEAFDLTDPERPVRLLNIQTAPEAEAFTAVFEDQPAAAAHYLAQTMAARRPPAELVADLPSDLRSPAHGADEIILTYDDFYTDTLPLAAHRQAQGLRVQVVRVSDVYDEFSFGLETPQAIRDFLTYAYVNWLRPAPRYVLLIGDANLDYLDRFQTGRPNFVPTFIFDADDVGQTANDTWFAQVADDDPVPELAVGRLPARSLADVRTMVAKVLAYDAAPANPWQSRLLFVADNVPEHEAISEGWTAQVPPDYRVQRVYADRYPPGDPTADIVAAINQGAALVSYVGHGNIDRWGVWSGGRLFDVAAAGRLTNGVRLPLVVTATCLNGFFVHPYSDDTMAEILVRQADGGAIAAWSPTALGAPGEQALLFEAFFNALFGGAPTLGDAIAQAQAAAYRQGVSRELIETFTLFGDPALRLRLTPAQSRYLPLALRSDLTP